MIKYEELKKNLQEQKTTDDWKTCINVSKFYKRYEAGTKNSNLSMVFKLQTQMLAQKKLKI